MKTHYSIKSIFIILGLSLILPFQKMQGQDIDMSSFQIAREAFGDNQNYLGAIKALNELEEKYSSPDQSRGFYLQASLTYNAFLLNNPNTLQLIKSYADLMAPKLPELPTFEYEGEEVFKQIIERAANNQVIMINELHWFSRERYLTHSMLKDLYNQGFRYLGMEAISEKADSLMERGYPIASSGLYTLDPQMSNMIRTAIQLGYHVFGYDVYGKEREMLQAQNIYDQTMKKDPEAKILIHSGGEHSSKCSERKKMGYYFEKLSGITPYIIRQSNQLQIGKYDYSGLAIPEYKPDCRADLVVINGIPETDFKINPYAMYSSTTDIKRLANHLTDIEKQEGNLLSFYIAEEFNRYSLKAIPISNYLINKDLDEKTIDLPNGKYILIIRDANGETIEKKELAISAI